MAANPSIQLGTDGNWAIKEDNLLAYKKDGTRFFNKEFDFTRNTTATFVDKDGLIKESVTNTPRIDFTDDATGHLLLEPQSTNLIPYSEDFSQWTLGPNSTLTFESNVIAPDGSLGVYRLQNPQTGSTFLSIGFRNCRNFSLFVKAVTEGVNNQFNLDASGQPTDTKTATTKWQRFDRDFGTQANYNLSINNGIDNYASDIYIWGAQAEALSYATSYIPTFGSTATRNAEACNNSGSAQDFNSEEGVLYAEIRALSDDATRRDITISNGTTSNRVMLRYDNASNRVQAFIQVGGATNGNMNSTAYTITNFLKIAYKWKAGDFALWINGTEVDTSTDATSFSADTLTEVNFDRGENNAEFFYGKTKNLKVFKRAMSDGELYLLTVPQYQSYQEMATALNYTL